MEEEWLQDSLLGVVIPENSNTTIADALANDTDQGDSDSDSLLPSVKERSLLFFGMLDLVTTLSTESYSFLDR